MSLEHCFKCDREYDTDFFEECPHCEGGTWARYGANEFLVTSKTDQLFSPERSGMNGSPERACQKNIWNVFAPSRVSSA